MEYDSIAVDEELEQLQRMLDGPGGGSVSHGSMMSSPDGLHRRTVSQQNLPTIENNINLIEQKINKYQRNILRLHTELTQLDNELIGQIAAGNKDEIQKLKERKTKLNEIMSKNIKELKEISENVSRLTSKIPETRMYEKILKLLNDLLRHIKTILSEFFGKKKIDGGKTRCRNARSKKSKKSRTKKYRR